MIEQHSGPTVWSLFEISMRSHGWDIGVHSVCVSVKSCKIVDCVLLLFVSCHLFIVICKLSTIQAMLATTQGVQLSWKQSKYFYGIFERRILADAGTTAVRSLFHYITYCLMGLTICSVDIYIFALAFTGSSAGQDLLKRSFWKTLHV